MNIIDAYIKFNKGLVILISGLTGSNKTKSACEISKHFGINYINCDDYCNNDEVDIIKLSNGVKIKDWCNINIYNWGEINKQITTLKSDGVIVSGKYFISNKLNFKPDFHIHIKIKKQTMMMAKRMYAKNNNCEDYLKIIDTKTESLLINYIYTRYFNYNEESHIDKFINAKDISYNEVNEQILDYIYLRVQKYLQTVNIIDNDTSKENDILKNDPFDDKNKMTKLFDNTNPYDIEGVSNTLNKYYDPDNYNTNDLFIIGQ